MSNSKRDRNYNINKNNCTFLGVLDYKKRNRRTTSSIRTPRTTIGGKEDAKHHTDVGIYDCDTDTAGVL